MQKEKFALPAVALRHSSEPQDYPQAVATMEARVAEILAGRAPELLWFLEHSALYTAGTRADDSELLNHDLPTYRSGRGGHWTYHGPGQRVCYAVLDLRTRGRDVRAYVCALETWLKSALAELGVEAESRTGRIGLWVSHANGQEEKIAALGVRVRRWIAYHGVALNVAPNLEHFAGIVPCGLQGYGVTSLEALGAETSQARIDQVLAKTFAETFRVALQAES